MNSKLVLGSFVATLGLLAACGGGGDSTASGGSDLSAAPAKAAPSAAPSAKPAAGAGATSATVTTNKVTKNEGGCTLDLELPVVDAGDPTVNTAIAKALAAHDPGAACSDLDQGETMTVTAGFQVPTNERGLLAITLSEEDDASPAAHPNSEVNGLTFDLKTGKLLTLTDVLTPAGITAATDACTSSLAKALADGFGDSPADEKDTAADNCKTGLADDHLGFTVEKDGLHLQLDLPHALAAIGEQILPWDALRSGLAAGVAADWVAGIQ